MTESSDLVLRHVEDGIARVTINRPDKLNALNREVIRRLADTFEDLARDESVRGAILTGAGDKAFVAGADIREMVDLSPEQARAFAREGQALGRLFDEFGRPIVAAVNGFALGGGCELAMACHLRVASPKARFGQPEVQLGLIPGFGGTQRLPRLVGEARALEMVLTGQMIDAETALAWGLVNRIARERTAVEEAEDLLRAILDKGPVAVRLAVEAVRTGLSMPLDDALEYEAALFGVIFSTEDMREGTTAFLEKRPPRFTGR
ncbi:MAG: enoyl-CoA hydratase-related protein [Acidobacteriota bacterium]